VRSSGASSSSIVSIIRSASATSSSPAGESSTFASASRPARVRGRSPRGTPWVEDAVRHCGLDVTVHQSDRKRAPGHLSHEGPELLRWALFEAAQQACRPASPDYEYYRQVARRIDHNRACLSVARKLCRRAYHILRELGDEALAPIETPDREEVIAAAA
jgi:Transposase IS116/IS110/IS902 family